MNILTINNITNNYVLYWKTNDFSKNDDNGKEFPTPIEREHWSGKRFFLMKLITLENELLKKNNTFIDDIHQTCLICKAKNISHLSYQFKNMIWSESLVHYIKVHNIKPPAKFIRFVLDNDPITKINLQGKKYKNGKCAYVKIHTNQLLIIDALFEHGSLAKKYKEKHESAFRYSEHAGMLDIDLNGIKYITVSGKTTRKFANDPSIYLPEQDDYADIIEYIFHTHPMTPRAGGRVASGILYEYPSAMDILHFVDHFNHSNLQGSLVLTAEGLYNIRKELFDRKIILLGKTFIRDYRKAFATAQDIAILKYGDEITDDIFYNKIAQDTNGIDIINALLKKYKLCIDFFPRQKNKEGNWIIGTVYLPVCVSQ